MDGIVIRPIWNFVRVRCMLLTEIFLDLLENQRWAQQACASK